MNTPWIRIMLLASGIANLQAAITIGTDTFDYPDGLVANRSGGTGWDYQHTDEGHPNGPSLWTGSAVISGNTLVTDNTVAFRKYSGTTTGPAVGTGESEGSIRGTGSVFFGATLTLLSYNPSNPFWCGISSCDFGVERLFFGLVSSTGKFGFSGSSVGEVTSSIVAANLNTYRLVAQIDFDNDALRLWINPDADDNLGTADLSVAYHSNHWSTEIRLGSGGEASWDHLIVTTPAANEPDGLHAFQLAAVPEPSFTLLTLLGILGFLRRRRQGGGT